MTSDTPSVPAPRRSRLPAWLRATRPKQWVKNVLVVAAPVAAGRVLDSSVLVPTLAAFVAFCLISASVYLINDVRDAEADRVHPTKRFRPIAAGELSPKAAVSMAVLCALAALGLSWWVTPMLSATIGAYWALQVAYSLWWKHQPIIDLVMVSAGFLLRAIAGGVACDLMLSQWFLLVASFGSLFVVAGKRYSEFKQLGAEAGTRASLERYSLSYLGMVWQVSLAVVIVCYSLWAFDQAGHALGVGWSAVSIAPFTLVLLRYAWAVDAGKAGEPEDVVLSDHVLQALAVCWVVPVLMAVFSASLAQ